MATDLPLIMESEGDYEIYLHAAGIFDGQSKGEMRRV
jgi:hypothetical protein